MAIRRSNTAPQSFEYQVRPGLARAKSTVDGFIPRLDRTSVPASSHHRFSASVATAASPRDREDPFSLTDFFPASYLSSPGEHWEWLRQEQTFEPDEGEPQSEGVDGSLPDMPGPVVFARGAEDEIEETIKGEDKMGVLSVLNTIFLTQDGEDESVNHESLYLALGRLGQVAESSSSRFAWWPVRWALHAMSSIV
ncbi:hypothetical protein BD769DRAFT_377885 [Suillus cothurnatus]|jgi:hypothetical protein|nr:hypothetical protein BD769DRAFT_377885 [Suillus cothurnatus]